MKPHYIWNHRVHQEWAKERLYFIMLSFRPTYDPVNIFERVFRLFHRKNILSHVMYEMTGDNDIVMRIWLPPTITVQQLQENLIEALAPCNLRGCMSFHVQQINSHWVWDEGTDQLKEPTKSTLSSPLDDDSIKKINDGTISETDFEKYKSKNLITEWKPKKGIKFMILIPGDKMLGFKEQIALVERIKEILSIAKGALETSIYTGAGFAQILIMGRIQHQQFDDTIWNLISKINDIGLKDFFSIRTYTHIIVNCARKTLRIQEHLPLSLSEQVPQFDLDVVSLLKEPESSDLEIKASTFIDMNRLLLGDGRKVISDRITNEGVCRAVVGFLNSDGGNVLIGALEQQKYERHGLKTLKDCPIVGDYILCGVEIDYQGKNWDYYQLRLLDILEKRIVPSPMPWLNVYRAEVAGKELCILSLRRPSSDWFYLNYEGRMAFFVRQGNRTIELPGPSADQYKRAHPRPH